MKKLTRDTNKHRKARRQVRLCVSPGCNADLMGAEDRCPKHLEIEREKMRELRRTWKKRGLCSQCGGVKQISKLPRCSWCVFNAPVYWRGQLSYKTGPSDFVPRYKYLLRLDDKYTKEEVDRFMAARWGRVDPDNPVITPSPYSGMI